jgi:hypothetical protein
MLIGITQGRAATFPDLYYMRTVFPRFMGPVNAAIISMIFVTLAAVCQAVGVAIRRSRLARLGFPVIMPPDTTA